MVWIGQNERKLAYEDQLEFSIYHFQYIDSLDDQRNIYCRDCISSGTITNEFHKEPLNLSREQVKSTNSGDWEVYPDTFTDFSLENYSLPIFEEGD